MNSSGEIQLLKWDREFQWVKIWWKPYDVCDVNDYCGNFTTRNRHYCKQCQCLPGFRPRLGNGDEEQFKECLRKSQCSTTNNDTFIQLTNIIVKNLDTRIFTTSEEECIFSCIKVSSHTHSLYRCKTDSYSNATQHSYYSLPHVRIVQGI